MSKVSAGRMAKQISISLGFLVVFVLIAVAGDSINRKRDNGANLLYNFASNENLDSSKSYLWASSVWEDSLRYRYFHSLGGDLEYSIKEYWETTQWEYNFNSGYTYDESGRLIERIDQDWESDYFEYVILRTNISYNPDGAVADSIEQYWSSFHEQWDDNARSKYSFTYDGFGNQIEYLHQNTQWIDAQPHWQWENRSKNLYTYDGSNNLTEDVYQTWDNDMQTWYTLYRSTMEYDGNNNRTDSTTQDWNVSEWVYLMKYSFSYDIDDNMIEEIHQYHDGDIWVNTWKFEYGYDGNGNQTSFFEQYWAGGEWDNSWKDASTYDGNNRLIENIGEYWNWAIEVWEYSDKFVYTYDLNGNETEYLGQKWDGSWNNDEQRINYYSEITATETGEGVDVEITLDEDITLLFDSVSVAGSTSAEVCEACPSFGFNIHDLLPFDSTIIFITTDAEFVGGVELCFSYEDGGLSPEDEVKLRIYHYNYELSVWTDITDSRDWENKIICGKTESLSPFILAVPAEPVDVDENGNSILPKKFTLDQNYPNPFNPATVISYSLASRANVKIEIINILGQSVRELINKSKAAGDYSVTWDGLDNNGHTVSTGLYFYKIDTGNFTKTKKMLLLK